MPLYEGLWSLGKGQAGIAGLTRAAFDQNDMEILN